MTSGNYEADVVMAGLKRLQERPAFATSTAVLAATETETFLPPPPTPIDGEAVARDVLKYLG
eukprot:4491954-Prorocentrum_lima.AAC.1